MTLVEFLRKGPTALRTREEEWSNCNKFPAIRRDLGVKNAPGPFDLLPLRRGGIADDYFRMTANRKLTGPEVLGLYRKRPQEESQIDLGEFGGALSIQRLEESRWRGGRYGI